MRSPAILGAAGIFLLAMSIAAAAEVPGLPVVAKERLDRALALLAAGGGMDDKVRNLALTPRWIANEDRFWYKRDDDVGSEYRLLDAATGTARTIIRADALAEALGQGLSRTIASQQILITDIASIDGKLKATVSFEGKIHSCVLETAPECAAASGNAPDPTRSVSPDGRSALFLRDHNLWLLDIASGEERALTTDGVEHYEYGYGSYVNDFRELFHLRGEPRKPTDIYWSPDSRHILVARIDRRSMEPYPYTEMVPQDGSFRPRTYTVPIPLLGDPVPAAEWSIISLDGSKAVRLDLPDIYKITQSFAAVEWAPDASALFVLAQKQDNSAMTVLRIDPVTGWLRTLVDDASLSGRIYVGDRWGMPPFRLIKGGAELVTLSAHSGWVHLNLHDAVTGRLKNRITNGEWRVWEILDVDDRARTITFTAKGADASNPYYRSVHRARLDGTAITRLTPAGADYMVVDPRATGPGFDATMPYRAISPSGRYLVVSRSTPAMPPLWSIHDTSTGRQIAEFDRADASRAYAAGYRPPEEMTAMAEDGSTLHGLVYRPAEYDPKQKYPVIDTEYGAPIVAITPRNFATAATMPIDQFNPAATAQLGFIVVVVDARGTPGRSEAFSRPKPDYLSHMGLADHVAFLREVARRDPAADIDRVGISGVSFGGWTAIRGLLAFPDIFKAGIAGAPPGSFHSMYEAMPLTFPQGEPDYGKSGVLRPTPTAIPTNYVSIDNNAQIDRMRGSMLMIVGEQDENVPPASSLQFFSAAAAKNKDIDLVYLPNATHSGAYTAYARKTGWNFLLEKLRGERLPAGLRVPSPLDGGQ